MLKKFAIIAIIALAAAGCNRYERALGSGMALGAGAAVLAGALQPSQTNVYVNNSRNDYSTNVDQYQYNSYRSYNRSSYYGY